MNINMMLIFDVIVGILGVYLTYVTQKMKAEMKVPEMFVTEQEMKRCKDKNGFINFIYSKALALGIVCILFGLEGFYNDVIYDFGNFVNIAVIITFLAVWGYFSYCLRKARRDFFSQI